MLWWYMQAVHTFVDFEENYQSQYLSTAASVANIFGMAVTMSPAAHPEISIKTKRWVKTGKVSKVTGQQVSTSRD